MTTRIATVVAGAALILPTSPAWSYELSDRFQISTLIEVEAFDTDDAERDFSGVDGSDIELATVEVGLDAQPTDRISGHVLLLYEEGEGDNVVLDEGTVSLALTDILGLTAGKEYVPFGRFETVVVSDPLTLELAETNETVVQLDFGSGALSGAVYGYSGDTTDAADGDSIEGAGASLDYEMDTGSANWVFGGSIISNIGDSDTLQEVEGGGAPGSLDGSVPGLGLHAMASFGRFTFIAEHVRALDDFEPGDFGGAVGAPSQPSATNLEAGFALTDAWSIGAAYRQTDEALFAGLPETMLAAAIGYQVSEHAALAVEINTREDYSVADGGTGEDSRTVLAQLAVEF